MSAIIVENLGKKYKRFPNHWARLLEIISAGRFCAHRERWALRELTFFIPPGEALGIIGQNGSGKSTLLKLLTGTTLPSEGSFELSGRIAALLELGLGFHGEFTGRENAKMACRILGLDREQSDQLLPEIISFSELGDYIDQPLRVYSTGMQMRLAFSAATALRPEILIVDEALAVGDAYFQHKCMKKIRSFKEKGTTLLFVSHDPGSVKSLCNRAILLDKGRMIRDGSPDTVFDYYNGMIAKKNKDEEIKQMESEYGRVTTRSGTGQARFIGVEMLDDNDQPARAFRVGDAAKICVKIKFHDSLENPTVGFIIKDRLGNDVFGTNTYHLNVDKRAYHPGDQIKVTFDMKLQIGRGNYSICVAVHTGYEHIENNFDWWDQCLVFQVIPNNSYSFVGCAALPVTAEIRDLTPCDP